MSPDVVDDPPLQRAQGSISPGEDWIVSNLLALKIAVFSADMIM